MIIIRTNALCSNEKKYIFKQIFLRFLGLDYKVVIDETQVQIELNFKKAKILINADFFNQFLKYEWLSKETIPSLPLKKCKIDEPLLFGTSIEELPILYGNSLVTVENETINIGIDFFGSCFFMLTRYEELVIKDKDNHGRFPVKSSIACKANFLTRPIVDEYVALLWNCIKHLWPELERKNNNGKTYVSCDVDFIQDKSIRFPGIIKRLGADLIKKKSIPSFIRSLQLFYKVSILGRKEFDPFNSFDFMMDECDKNNLKMAFYFIPQNKKKPIDGDYDIESSEASQLIKKIIKRGHEVGYHASYYSYKDQNRTLEEIGLLRKVYITSGGKPNEIKGGRQHYLRWETGVTEKNWQATGLVYDTTLGYAEKIGFRCGTAQEYHFYDCINRKSLQLLIRPLIVMEVSMLNKNYMDLSHAEAIITANSIKKQVKKVEGNFSLLWHNSSFNTKEDFKAFQEIIKK